MQIAGIFTPNVVPLHDDGEINEAELRRYVDWLIDQGLHGLFPNGSTGECVRFTSEERLRIARITIEQSDGRVPVLVGAAEANVVETLRASERYAEYGARAVAIVSPFYYRLGPDQVYAYFHEIAKQSPIDVLLYNIPLFASPIDAPTVRRLAELERIVGIKDSSGNIESMMQMMRTIQPMRPDFVFLTGWEATLLPMLLMGCQGGTNALSGIVPAFFRKLYDAVQAGDLELARQMQFDLLDLFNAVVYEIEFPVGLREAVELQGFQIGPSRQPLSDQQRSALPEIRERIGRALRSMGLDPAS